MKKKYLVRFREHLIYESLVATKYLIVCLLVSLSFRLLFGGVYAIAQTRIQSVTLVPLVLHPSTTGGERHVGRRRHDTGEVFLEECGVTVEQSTADIETAQQVQCQQNGLPKR